MPLIQFYNDDGEPTMNLDIYEVADAFWASEEAKIWLESESLTIPIWRVWMTWIAKGYGAWDTDKTPMLEDAIMDSYPRKTDA